MTIVAIFIGFVFLLIFFITLILDCIHLIKEGWNINSFFSGVAHLYCAAFFMNKDGNIRLDLLVGLFLLLMKLMTSILIPLCFRSKQS